MTAAAAYLHSLTAHRRVSHIIHAAKAGRTPLEHAEVVLREREHMRMASIVLNSNGAVRSILTRHADRNGRSFV